MFTRMQKIMVMLALLLLGGCASNITNEEIQPYTVSNNNIAVSGGPVIKINPDYRYAGAEIIPSLSKKLKRQIYAGPDGSFLTVAVFDSSSQAVRRAVMNPPNPEWEFIIAQRPGPRWIRITGNKTPCCINLLRSEYIFMPCSEPGSLIYPVAELPSEDLPGKLIVISYGIPLPDALVSGVWAGSEEGMEFLDDPMQPQLSYEDDAYASGLSPTQAAFLAEQEARAEAAWSME